MVLLLRQLLGGTGIEVDTVDAWQGREKEVTLICTVRSNYKVRQDWSVCASYQSKYQPCDTSKWCPRAITESRNQHLRKTT
eukprot:1159936-Pelagomonas_calceolata.AAC.5